METAKRMFEFHTFTVLFHCGSDVMYDHGVTKSEK